MSLLGTKVPALLFTCRPVFVEQSLLLEGWGSLPTRTFLVCQVFVPVTPLALEVVGRRWPAQWEGVGREPRERWGALGIAGGGESRGAPLSAARAAATVEPGPWPCRLRCS